MAGMQVVNLDHERGIPMLPVTVPEGSPCNLNGCDTQQMSLGMGQQQRLTRSLVSVGSSVCRICHTNMAKESLISPCRCKGTLAYVHLSCLERWLNQSCRTYCELCRYHFNAIKTPRYRWPESLRIWVSDPRNRRNIQSDLLILTLLSIVTVGLVTVCLLGMRYFVIEGKKNGISKLWTRGAIWFLLTIVILGYITTVYLLGKRLIVFLQLTIWMLLAQRVQFHRASNESDKVSIYYIRKDNYDAKDQVSPWYRWWKSTVNVRLVMDTQLFRGPSNESFPGYENQTTGNSILSNTRCINGLL